MLQCSRQQSIKKQKVEQVKQKQAIEERSPLAYVEKNVIESSVHQSMTPGKFLLQARIKLLQLLITVWLEVRNCSQD